MLKTLFTLFLVFFGLQKALAFDVCDMYLKRYHDNNFFVSADILSLSYGTAELLVLGQSRSLSVTVNGIDINDMLYETKEIICANRRAGEIRFYNLNKLNLDAGFFEARVTGARGSDTAQAPYSLK